MFTEELEQAMNEIGFLKQNRHYIHPECKHLFIEFPGTVPLGIGKDYLIKPDEHEINGKVIKILSPTDCVKDRLATFMYFNDREGLDQAVVVTKKHPINFESVEKWCEGEQHTDVYREFIELLK